jgi:hypothetical protein
MHLAPRLDCCLTISGHGFYRSCKRRAHKPFGRKRGLIHDCKKTGGLAEAVQRPRGDPAAS